jgi:GMP synthase-like glutamine amidotransferase
VASGKAWVVLQHVAHEEAGAIGEVLIAAGQVVSVVRVDRGDPVPGPAEVADMAGLVVMGGPMGVHDDEAHPWLAHERDLIAAAVAAARPVLGVCLGAQQLAVALGGEVTTGPEPEVGIGEVRLTRQAEDDAVFGPVGFTLPCMHWHGDTFSLPAGSVLLARSELYPHQAFRHGERAYGLQFHVEITPAVAARWRPHLPPGVSMPAVDVAHINAVGRGLIERFVAPGHHGLREGP